jgi:hypothetical protein
MEINERSHMEHPAHILPLHVERGEMMRTLVSQDVLGGLTFEAAVERLAAYLEIEVEAVKLGIAIANEWA